MPNTDEWWSIDGQSLHERGWSVATVGGGRYDLPPRRGENITVAYRPGQIHRRKLAEARVITLIMWLIGADPTTGNSTADPTLTWNDSWDYLRRLVWKSDGGQVSLTRRWKLTVDGTPQIVTASALAEIQDSMTPTMTGRTRADFTMSLLLADPYFYGPQEIVTLPKDTYINVTNRGHDIAAYANMTLVLHGPLVNPRVTNLTAIPPVWVQYTHVMSAGQTCAINIGDFTAVQAGQLTIADITHAGARHWMGLVPGVNTLQLTADSGSGTATLTFQPPYV